MRTTYTRIDTPFPAHRMTTTAQRPKKIVVHRQGNPGAEGENGIKWMVRTGAASIHRYIDDEKVFFGIPTDRHAFHVRGYRRTEEFGLPFSGQYGPRGDYDTIGVECEDEDQNSAQLAPGQTYGLSQETRISLVLVLRDLIREYPDLTVMDIIRHQELDPWTRPEDTGDALNLADLRADVQDLLDGEAPWRTVQTYATGAAAPQSWKPIPPAVALPSLTTDALTIHMVSSLGRGLPWNTHVRTVDRGGGYEDRVYEMVVRTKK